MRGRCGISHHPIKYRDNYCNSYQNKSNDSEVLIFVAKWVRMERNMRGGGGRVKKNTLFPSIVKIIPAFLIPNMYPIFHNVN